MDINLSSVVDATAIAVGREVNELRELTGTQTSYDPTQVGKYIEPGDIQGGVDPAEDRTLTFARVTDSTSLWRSGGLKSSMRNNMAEAIVNSLTRATRVCNTGGASMPANDGGDAGSWAQAVPGGVQ